MTTLLALCLCLSWDGAGNHPSVLIVIGAPGQPEYEAQFRHWAQLWQAAAKQAGAEAVPIGLSAAGPTSDRDRLHSALAERATAGQEPLWLVLIGHGTFDGHEAKFNLRGPDLSDVELAAWLAPLKRPLIVLNCASASGPFLNRLSGPGRIIVTATRSGDEQNFARFGQYLAGAITDLKSDLDKDGQVSLLEAFLTASKQTDEFYRTRSRLATEHALLDDNGDRRGTPADWFRGVRAFKRAQDGTPADGLRAHQTHLILRERERAIPPEMRRRRDEIEMAIAALRDQKDKLGEDAYYGKLEPLMIELARLYRDAHAQPGRR